MTFRSIAIEGPIGAGKTALAERLGTRLDATVVLEETENPFLADFYADRPGAALQAQLFFLLNRHRQQTSLRQSDLFTETTICDYLFDKDKIFAFGEEVTVVMDRKSYLFLNGTEIDFQKGMMKTGFEFKNPMASRSCSCGESFSL